MKGKSARFGSLAVGVLGALLNLMTLSQFHPLFLGTGLAGLLGILLVAAMPRVGGILAFLGILLPLLISIGALVAGGYATVLAVVLLPGTLLMIWGALRVSGMVVPSPVLRNLQFQCDGCGVWFAREPNPWNDAGCCSRKCLEQSR